MGRFQVGRKSGNRGYSSHVSTKHDPGAKFILPLILENADFRPPMHVSGGCQWLVASSVRQRPKSPIPVPTVTIPDLAGRSGIGEGIPDSRFGGNRETGNPRFSIRPGPGIRVGVPMPVAAARRRRAGEPESDFLVCESTRMRLRAATPTSERHMQGRANGVSSTSNRRHRRVADADSTVTVALPFSIKLGSY
jgi:hypothetical protein